MEKKKAEKKPALTLCLLLFLLAALVAAVYLYKEPEGETEEETGIELYSLDTSQTAEISFQNESGLVELVKDGNTWIKKEDKDFPLDQSAVSAMLSAMESVQASREVTKEADDLSQYGLENPSLDIRITLEDGTSVQLMLGDRVPVAGGRYGMTGGRASVYIMEETLFSAFSYTENQLIQMEEIPEIDENQITSLSVRNGEESQLLVSQDKNQVFWIEGAYAKQVRAGSNVTDLFLLYTALSFEECVAYNKKDASEYGIQKDGKQVTIQYVTETEEEEGASIPEEYHLLIGDQAENGSYYVQPEGSESIYRMNGETVASMLEPELFQYVETAVFLDTLDTVEALEVESQGQKNSCKIIETEDTQSKEEGEGTQIQYSCTVNGKETDYDTFKEKAEQLYTISYVKEIVKKEGEDSPAAAVTLKLKTGQTRTYTFFPYDGENYYRVNIDGTELFLVEKKSVDTAVKGLLGI